MFICMKSTILLPEYLDTGMKRAYWPRMLLVLLVAIPVLDACALGNHERSADNLTAVEHGNIDLPNIFLIVADDLGWSDIGAYGSEISTPNLDALAANGLQLSSFIVTPGCSPTRSMLMTGIDNHLNGLGRMAENKEPKYAGQAGYEGHLHASVMTIASMLKQAGYRTSIAGKWHLGYEEAQAPFNHGFDNSFVLLDGAASHLDNLGIYEQTPHAIYRENGRRTFPPEGFYSSILYADKVIEYMGHKSKEGEHKPFFANLYFTAPHWPLQAPDEFISKYKGRYDKGYRPIFEQRIRQIKASDLLPGEVTSWPDNDLTEQWESLDSRQRQDSARAMEIYAAMVDSMDHEIGRVIQHLRETDQYENTFILFISDNGASAVNQAGLVNPRWLKSRFDNSIGNMGKKGSFVAYDKGWAQVSSAPFYQFKGSMYEGGIRSPAIISFPGGDVRQGQTQVTALLEDIVPTLLGLAFPGRDVFDHLTGVSMLRFLRSQVAYIHDDLEPIARELQGNRMIRQGNWKLVWPRKKAKWELYDLATDPFEQNNLIDREPERAKYLIELWNDYAASNNVLL